MGDCCKIWNNNNPSSFARVVDNNYASILHIEIYIKNSYNFKLIFRKDKTMNKSVIVSRAALIAALVEYGFTELMLHKISDAGLFRIFLATLALTDQDLLAEVIEKYDITSDDIKSL